MLKDISIGEKYGKAMTITDQIEADNYFDECVRHTMINFDKNREEAERIERSNIGYYTGYYDKETAERIFKLFNCYHPIFGKSLNLDPNDIIKIGYNLGKKIK